MPIPDFQSIMLPFLKTLGDDQERTMKDMALILAKEFQLSEEELAELLPSGQQRVFTNRVAWAKAHLKMGGLVDNPSRGRVRLSPTGRQVLDQNPDAINLRFLKQFEKYNEAVRGGSNGESPSAQAVDETEGD